MSELMIVDAIVVVMYILFGTFGNVLIIAAAILRPNLRTPPNLFIVNVAVTDLVMASYGMSSVLVHVIKGDSDVTVVMCIATGMTVVVSCGVSLLSLCFIAFNRYMSVCQFQSYTRVFTRRNLSIMIGGIWSFSLGVVLVSYYGGLCAYHYDPSQVTCTYNNQMRPCTYLFIVVGIAVPSILATTFYALIYRKLHETSVRLHQHSSPKNGQKKARKSRKEIRTIVMMFTAFALFVIVWFPYGIVMIIDGYIPQSPLLIKVVTWLAFSNCGINWIVYGAMNRNFRAGYRDVIMGCRKATATNGSTDDSGTPKPQQDVCHSDGTINEQRSTVLPPGVTVLRDARDTRDTRDTRDARDTRASTYHQTNGDSYKPWLDT